MTYSHRMHVSTCNAVRSEKPQGRLLASLTSYNHSLTISESCASRQMPAFHPTGRVCQFLNLSGRIHLGHAAPSKWDPRCDPPPMSVRMMSHGYITLPQAPDDGFLIPPAFSEFRPSFGSRCQPFRSYITRTQVHYAHDSTKGFPQPIYHRAAAAM